MENSPFNLGNDDAYSRWKENKLKNYPTKLEDLLVEVNDPRKFSKIELEELIRLCRKANMAIYVGKTGNNPDPEIPLSIGRQFGVHKIDKNWLAGDNSLSSLKLQENPKDKQLAPYTNSALNWHTDGYYNSNDEQIQSMMLHSVQSAAEGGENRFFDHEIAYILLRDENPDHIITLMQNDVLSIPPRVQDGNLERNTVTGPVFRITNSGNLHMRYTIRKTNVFWIKNKRTESAKKSLRKILDTETSFIFKTILKPGSGLVSNNIIHSRNSFVNDEFHKRHFYRSRYFERLNGTSAVVN
tara:strand:- start:1384 stop:2277 length:894 start_codon:yes stop_codon:yes gene_type:complete